MRPDGPRVLALYLRTHHVVVFTGGLVVLGALLGLSKRSTRGISTWDGSASTSMAIAAEAALGAIAATTWLGRGGGQEDVLLTREPALARRLHPVVATLASGLVAALVAAVVDESGARAVAAARAVVVWAALGFLGATCWHAHLAWGLPAVYFLVLGLVGYTPSGSPVWWNVPLRSPTDPVAWMLTALVVVAASGSVVRATR